MNTVIMEFLYIVRVLMYVIVPVDAVCYNSTQQCFWIRSSGSSERDTANTNCLAEGGELSTIATQDVWDFVKNEFGGTTGIWTGLSYRMAKPVFRWPNGQPLTYDAWNTGEPNGITNDPSTQQECVSIWYTSFKMHDAVCSSTPPYRLCSTPGM